MTRSERVNGWRLNPNITQALIPPIGLVLTWLDLFYSMWFLLGQMNGYGWPIYIAVKTSANLTNWDGLSLLYYHLVLLTLEHSGSSSWGIWNQKKKIIIRTHLFIGTSDLLPLFQVYFATYFILILIFLSMILYYQNQVFTLESGINVGHQNFNHFYINLSRHCCLFNKNLQFFSKFNKRK